MEMKKILMQNYKRNKIEFIDSSLKNLLKDYFFSIIKENKSKISFFSKIFHEEVKLRHLAIDENFSKILSNSSEGLNLATIDVTTLVESMVYSLVGGKKIRSIIFYLIAENLIRSEYSDLTNIDTDLIDKFALALELIQAYSLVHDDLPSFDNDDYRRGKYSTHKKYGECFAILCGDALLNLSMEILTQASLNVDSYINYIRAINYLYSSIGFKGMIKGQFDDIFLERYSDNQVSLGDLINMEINKTACLFSAAFVLPFVLFGLPQKDIELMRELSYKFGLAFQIQDDILDNEANQELLGKSKGKDLFFGKKTFYTILGAERAKEVCFKLFDEVYSSMRYFDSKIDFSALLILLKEIQNREY